MPSSYAHRKTKHSRSHARRQHLDTVRQEQLVKLLRLDDQSLAATECVGVVVESPSGHRNVAYLPHTTYLCSSGLYHARSREVEPVRVSAPGWFR